MRVITPSKDHVIEWQQEEVTPAFVEKFRLGTSAQHSKLIPLTLPTAFRRPEFDWLEKLEVDMHDLLHTEQEYQYFKPLEIGDKPIVRTWVSNFRERKGKQFSLSIIEFTSDVVCKGEKKLTSITNFVVKTATKE